MFRERPHLPEAIDKFLCSLILHNISIFKLIFLFCVLEVVFVLIMFDLLVLVNAKLVSPFVTRGHELIGIVLVVVCPVLLATGLDQLCFVIWFYLTVLGPVSSLRDLLFPACKE